MSKNKTKTINISITPTKFTSLFNRLRGEKSDYEFDEILNLKKLLSQERTKLLYTIKYEKPRSLYQLAKILKRDFKSVREDAILFEKFGFIDFEKTSNGNRKSLKPVLVINSLHIIFEV
jgi:predicted transcriptional regulator